MTEETKILEKLGQLDHQWKEADRKRDDEIKQHGEALSDTKAKLEAIEKETARLEDVQKRLDDLELQNDTPLRERDGVTKAERKHLEAFDSWVRDPRNHEKCSALVAAAAEVNTREKTVAGNSPAAGGYAVPEVIGRRIGEKLQDISMMRQLVRVVPVGTTDYKELIDINGETASWVGETGTRNETNTPQLAEVAPTMGMLYANPTATEESLDDIYFNVEDWLVRKVSVAFAKAEGAAFISGTGSNSPTGFLNGSPSSAGDEDSPARAFGTLQYIASGVADGLGSPVYTSPGLSYPQDLLIDLETALKPGYRQNAKYLMNRATLAVIRKWKDADGNYLWQRSMQAGQPSLLNGYPVVEMEDMPAIGTNAFPIAFGDFMEGYLAVDRIGLRMTVNNITLPGYVQYYVRRRQGGKLYNDDAIKLIKCATT